MKIFLCLALIIVSVYGERSKRQSWNSGLWGREYELDNAKRKEKAAVSGLLEDGQTNSHFNEQRFSESKQDDRPRLRNEVLDSKIPLPQLIGQERSRFEYLRYPEERRESPAEE